MMSNGFRYGTEGVEKVRNITGLIGSFGDSNLFSPASTIMDEVTQQTQAIKSEILAEFFSTTRNHAQLFDLAKKFETVAFGVGLTEPYALEPEMKSILGLVCDFHGYDRKYMMF